MNNTISFLFNSVLITLTTIRKGSWYHVEVSLPSREVVNFRKAHGKEALAVLIEELKVKPYDESVAVAMEEFKQSTVDESTMEETMKCQQLEKYVEITENEDGSYTRESYVNGSMLEKRGTYHVGSSETRLVADGELYVVDGESKYMVDNDIIKWNRKQGNYMHIICPEARLEEVSISLDADIERLEKEPTKRRRDEEYQSGIDKLVALPDRRDCDAIIERKFEDVLKGQWKVLAAEARESLKKAPRRSAGENDDTVTIKLYKWCVNKEGVEYRKTFPEKGTDFVFTSEDLLERIDYVVATIEDYLAKRMLFWGDELDCVLSGAGVRKLTDARREMNEEWADSLLPIDLGSGKRMLVFPVIATIAEDDTYTIVNRACSEGIQTGTVFDQAGREARGVWEDYTSITNEVKARNRVEAERFVVNPLKVAEEVLVKLIQSKVDAGLTKQEMEKYVKDSAMNDFFADFKIEHKGFYKFQPKWYATVFFASWNRAIEAAEDDGTGVSSVSANKAHFDFVMEVVKLQKSEKAAADLIRGGDLQITKEQAKAAITHARNNGSNRIPYPVYKALTGIING